MKEFFKDKKVLITGHTGFQGAWLARILLLWGANVSGYSLIPSTAPSLFDVFQLNKTMENSIGDICDAQLLQETIDRVAPDIIFHLAAQAIVRNGYYDPLNTYTTNVLGTANVLEAIRKSASPARTVVVITTDKVYLNQERSVAYVETDPLGGYDPYSASKAAADIVTSSYRSSFFHPDAYGTTHHTIVSTARSGNVIGGGDWAPYRIVPDIVRAWYETYTPVVLRCPGSIRPWQHVFEPLYGYLLLAERGYGGDTTVADAWNFGPDYAEAQSVMDLVTAMQRCTKQGEYRIEVADGLHEAGTLLLDSTRAKELLGWKQQFSFESAVRTTAAWYAQYYNDPSTIIQYSIEDIEVFFR